MKKTAIVLGLLGLGVWGFWVGSRTLPQDGLYAGPVKEPPIIDPLLDPPVIKAAPEKEWTPARANEPGKVESGLLQLVPSAQSLQSAQPASSKEQIKPDLRLPSDDSSRKIYPVPGVELPREPIRLPMPDSKADLPPAVQFPPITVDQAQEVAPLLPKQEPKVAVPPKADAGLVLPELEANIPKLPHEETPMIGRKLAYAAVFGAAILSAPMNAHAAEVDKDKEDVKAMLEKLERSIADLKSLEKNLSANSEQFRQVKDEVESLKNRIRYVEDDLKFLRARLDSPSTTSKRESTLPTTTPGKLRLVNDFLEEMSVRVNDRSYRLMPGEDLTVSVPSGMYVYQVLQLQRIPQERVINPGETKTIRIFVQR